MLVAVLCKDSATVFLLDKSPVRVRARPVLGRERGEVARKSSLTCLQAGGLPWIDALEELSEQLLRLPFTSDVAGNKRCRRTGTYP